MIKKAAVLTACIIFLAACANSPSDGVLAVNTADATAAAAENNGNGTQAVGNNENGTQAVNVAVEQQSAPAPDEAQDEVIEINEKLFIAQTNDIYYNAEDYLGKTIKYEGVMDVFEVPDTGVRYYSVIRYGPGCCGTDGNVGFEVKWDKEYPDADAWVEATGVLEAYEEDGYNYLRLALTSLAVMPERGNEYVAQ